MREIFEAMDKAIKELDEATEEFKRNSINAKAINIIIDDSDPQAPIFVEIEADNGISLSIGEDSRTDENYRKLHITVDDIIGQNDFKI